MHINSTVDSDIASPCFQHGQWDFFFIFNTFFKLISNQILFVFFFKTNIFGRAYCHGMVKRLCRVMDGGAAGEWRGDDRGCWPVTWQGLPRHRRTLIGGAAAPGTPAACMPAPAHTAMQRQIKSNPNPGYHAIMLYTRQCIAVLPTRATIMLYYASTSMPAPCYWPTYCM